MKSVLPTAVPLADIAFLLDVTERRVQQLAGLGVLARERQGYYPLAESVRSYIRYLRKQKESMDSHELHKCAEIFAANEGTDEEGVSSPSLPSVAEGEEV